MAHEELQLAAQHDLKVAGECIEPRFATSDEVQHLIGFRPTISNALAVAKALDQLNQGITYQLRAPFGIDVNYHTIPEAYRNDMAAIGVTLENLL